MTHIIYLFILMSLATKLPCVIRMMFFVERRPSRCELGYCKHSDAQVNMRCKQIWQIMCTFNCGPETFLCNQRCRCQDVLVNWDSQMMMKAQHILCLDPLVIGPFLGVGCLGHIYIWVSYVSSLDIAPVKNTYISGEMENCEFESTLQHIKCVYNLLLFGLLLYFNYI